MVTVVTTDVSCITAASSTDDWGLNAIALQYCMASYDSLKPNTALDIIKTHGGEYLGGQEIAHSHLYRLDRYKSLSIEYPWPDTSPLHT
jgi:hypothetical protein